LGREIKGFMSTNRTRLAKREAAQRLNSTNWPCIFVERQEINIMQDYSSGTETTSSDNIKDTAFIRGIPLERSKEQSLLCVGKVSEKKIAIGFEFRTTLLMVRELLASHDSLHQIH
jgi:hypothetical protein